MSTSIHSERHNIAEEEEDENETETKRHEIPNTDQAKSDVKVLCNEASIENRETVS